MDPSHDHPPATLLTRRAAGEDLPHAEVLLAAAGVPADPVQAAARARLLFVLDEVACAFWEPPLAALVAAVSPDGRDGTILGFSVTPAHRRTGLARRLITDVVTLLRAEGISSLSVEVEAGSPADTLLASLGFVETGPGPADRRYARQRLVRDI